MSVHLIKTCLYCLITQVLNEALLTDRAEGVGNRHTMPQSLVIYHKCQYVKCLYNSALSALSANLLWLLLCVMCFILLVHCERLSCFFFKYLCLRRYKSFSLQPAEGSNEFLKLLKSHKEKLEVGMGAVKRRNEELEKERADNEKERENLLATVEQLRSKLSQVVHLCSICLLIQLDILYG